ncbi:protein MCM10 homolog isoform X2 [Strongylocentrotus purpuratus]|uniref:Protein MCM10 homolog n=1 Tax=Strongylocentrotus purpuratus TaxID=7668 RepID=A0A7M7SSE4_STRPU|nr:protein MCM10 homolog isoform X2 [Strongylocentrotus purpuratus]
MADDDYADDLDALTSLLDDEDDKNPYDSGEPFSVRSQHSQKVSQAVKKHVTSQDKKKRSVGSSQSSDEEKSKQELIDELQKLREQMGQMQGGTPPTPQSSRPKENFSDSLFADQTPKQKQKKGSSAHAKKDAHSTNGDDIIDDDELTGLFDDEFEDEVQEKKDDPKATPHKAESLFKKSNVRHAHTPQITTAPPKKVSPYKCNLCDQTFNNKQAMTVHEFKHKVSRYSCEVCAKSFTSKLQLETHLRTHKPSGIQPKSSSPPEPNSQAGRSSVGTSETVRNSGGAMSRGSVGDRGSQKSMPHLGSGSKRKPMKEEEACETEYFSRIRIINPLVSSATMKERMKERKMIRMSILNHYSKTGALEGDWVTMGVLIRKIMRTDAKGKAFSIWTLNDLSSMDENVTLFLFGKIHEEHWKTVEGSVIGLLNACTMEKRENSNYKDSDNVQLRVDNPQKILLMGKSKDFGRCKSMKNDGQPCSQIINTSDCQYCAYHVQAEYKKAGSKRTDLSSSYSGITPKSFMKKIKKDNVFYGGQSMSMPSMCVVGGGVKSQSKISSFKSSKLDLKSLGVKGADSVMEEAKTSVLTLLAKGQKEEDMLVKVSGATKEFTNLLKAPSPGAQNLVRHMVKVEKTKKNVSTISADNLLKQHKQEMASKKAARAHTLGKPSSSSSTLTESTRFNAATPPINAAPMLGRGWSEEGDIDLGASPVRATPPRGNKRSGASTLIAKQRALEVIHKKGGIAKEDPNAVGIRKRMDQRKKEAVKRRVEENWRKDEHDAAEADSSTGSRAAKKRKTFLGQDVKMSKDEMDKILNAKSSHAGLLAEYEAELMERYFKEMEKKEGIENKLDSVRELKRKVVSCKECSFTWFFPSDLCKKEGHSLHWHEAKQRFFNCKDCNSRTIAFDRLPTRACRSCGSTSYERTSMLKERKGPKIGGETLLVRGTEERYL